MTVRRRSDAPARSEPSLRSGWGGSKAVATSVVVVAGLGACVRERPLPARDVVAVLAAGELRYGQFETYVEEQLGGEREAAIGSDALSGLLDGYLDEELLRRLAVERGIVAEGVGRRPALAALLAASPPPPPTDEAVARCYARHPQEFQRPERVRLRQILVDDRATAESARAEILAGADFGEVARRVSEDPTAGAGGDQGELAREDLPPAFAEAIFRLAPGRVSEVVVADYGFLIFQVVRREPAERLPAGEAAPAIRDLLSGRAAEAALGGFLAEARSRYNPQVYAGNLPFPYRGAYPVARLEPDG